MLACQKYSCKTTTCAPPSSPYKSMRSVSACQAAVTGSVAISTPRSNPVVVVGAGIAGLAAAVALTKVGIPTVVLEEGAGPRKEGAAIGLWSNAWRALDALDVAQPLREQYLCLDRVELCSSDGRLLRYFGFSECGSPGFNHEFRGVRRSALLEALAAGLPKGTVRYGCKVVSVLEDGNAQVEVELSSGERVLCSALVGADGVHSAVANHLGMRKPTLASYMAFRGVATFPNGVPFPLNTIRQVWGRGVRAGLYPLSSTECYWFATANNVNQPNSAKPLTPEQRQMQAAALVKGWRWQLEDIIQATAPADISNSRLQDRFTLGTFGRGVVTLAGDAAHPMTPNLGQGGCAALEDAVVLARTLSKSSVGVAGSAISPQQLAAALRQYEAERSKRCLPITLRSNAMGQALQIPLLPVCAVRDAFVSKFFSPSHFLDHTMYDCGTLDA